ncbi:MAG: hypothetical protein IE909_16960 [Campylobacterales bacterium]|nr:hypothetical protein [Campylobacterales bacterium]
MGLDNPILGIGLSNFALHYKHYNEIRGVGFEAYNFKVIPNNVYAEIFSELGLIGFFIFIVFIYTLYKKTLYDKSHILRFGFIGSLVYFFAFSSFTILFIWVFFGLISSLKKEHYAYSH